MLLQWVGIDQSLQNGTKTNWEQIEHEIDISIVCCANNGIKGKSF